MPLNIPQHGCSISYSAGTSDLDPLRFRVLRGSDRLSEAAALIPQLGSIIGRAAQLLVVNCYPASIGAFNGAVFVDTYARQATFSRAMLLAQTTRRHALILGQPLLVLQLLLTHRTSGLPLPSSIILCMGGYWCPKSLEISLLDLCKTAGVESHIVHAYGVAEADAACLLGLSRDPVGEILFRRSSAQYTPEIDIDELVLVDHEGRVIRTGDSASLHGEYFNIRNPEARLSSELKALFESWSTEDWRRRTGFIGLCALGNVSVQLRDQIKPLNDSELPFYKFADLFGHSWLEKPRWGFAACFVAPVNPLMPRAC